MLGQIQPAFDLQPDLVLVAAISLTIVSAEQWLAPPVLADERKQPVLHLVTLPFPLPATIAVRAAAGHDLDMPSLGIG